MAAVKSGLWGIWRLGLVSVLAVAGFAIAVVSFRDVPASECLMEAGLDPAVTVDFLTPLRVDTVGHTVRVARDGSPVVGAQVCVRADRRAMPGLGVSGAATETGPGEYSVSVRFERAGAWDATVVVARAGQAPVRVPVRIEVGGP